MANFFTVPATQRGKPLRPLASARTKQSVGFTEPEILQYLLIAVVAIYFLVPSRLPWISASAQGVLLALVFLAHLVARRGRLDLNLLLPSAVFFVPLALAIVFSPGGYVLEYDRPLVLGGIASYLFAFYYRDPVSLRLYGVVLILVVLSAAFTVVLALVPNVLTWIPPSLRVLAWGTLDDTTLYGLFLIVGHLAFVHMYVRAPGHLLLGPLLVTTLAVIATASRGIWAGTLIATLAYLGLAHAGRRGAIVLLSMVLAFVGFRILMEARIDAYVRGGGDPANEPQAVAVARDIEWKSTFSKKNREDLSFEGRVGMILIGLRMWRSSPLIGIGPGKFPQRVAEFLPGGEWPAIAAEDRQLDPHNVYIAILTDAGAIGMVGFLGMLGLIMVRAQRRRRQETDGGAAVNTLMAIVIAFSVVGLAHDVHLDRLWWIMLGLLHGQSTPKRLPEQPADHYESLSA